MIGNTHLIIFCCCIPFIFQLLRTVYADLVGVQFRLLIESLLALVTFVWLCPVNFSEVSKQMLTPFEGLPTISIERACQLCNK